MKIEDVQELEGWHSFPEAAQALGVARQRINQLLDEGKLKSVRKVLGAGARPAVLLLSQQDLDRLLAEKEAAEAARAARQAVEAPAA